MKNFSIIVLVFFMCISFSQSTTDSNSNTKKKNSGDTMNFQLTQKTGYVGDSLIHVYNLKPNETIQCGVKIKREVNGMWYFEGNFPNELVDGDSVTIAEGVVSADGRWMTEKFVPYSANIEFSTGKKSGYIVFRRNNASGLPRHDRMFYLPVNFTD